jgi:hypothetical protein
MLPTERFSSVFECERVAATPLNRLKMSFDWASYQLVKEITSPFAFIADTDCLYRDNGIFSLSISIVVVSFFFNCFVGLVVILNLLT